MITQQNLAGEQAHVIAGQDPPDCAGVPRRPDSRQATAPPRLCRPWPRRWAVRRSAVHHSPLALCIYRYRPLNGPFTRCLCRSAEIGPGQQAVLETVRGPWYRSSTTWASYARIWTAVYAFAGQPGPRASLADPAS